MKQLRSTLQSLVNPYLRSCLDSQKLQTVPKEFVLWPTLDISDTNNDTNVVSRATNVASLSQVNLTEKQKIIYNVISRATDFGATDGATNDTINYEFLIEKTQIPRRTLQREISALCKLGLIKAMGNNMNRHWIAISQED